MDSGLGLLASFLLVKEVTVDTERIERFEGMFRGNASVIGMGDAWNKYASSYSSQANLPLASWLSVTLLLLIDKV